MTDLPTPSTRDPDLPMRPIALTAALLALALAPLTRAVAQDTTRYARAGFVSSV